LVEECLEIFLHLDGVVRLLSHAEDPELAVLPGPVLLEKEGQQHQQSSVVNDPPDIDVALDLVARIRIALSIGRIQTEI